MPIKHANKKIKQKRKTNFYWSDRKKHIYLDRLRIQFILTHKINKARVRRNRKSDYVIDRKRSDAPFTSTI